MKDSYTEEEMRAILAAGKMYATSRDGRYTLICTDATEIGRIACFFVRTEDGWVKQAEFQSSNESLSVSDVCISGDGSYAVIGDAYRDGTVKYQGAALVYARTGDTWDLQAILHADDPAPSECFGKAIGISDDGNYIAVGAPFKKGIHSGRGAVYVFLRSGDTWHLQANLHPSNASAEDNFGRTLAVSSDGGFIIVGCVPIMSALNVGGIAYNYSRTGTTWTARRMSPQSNVAISHLLHHAIAISSDDRYLTFSSWAQSDSLADTLICHETIYTKVADEWRARITIRVGNIEDRDFTSAKGGQIER